MAEDDEGTSDVKKVKKSKKAWELAEMRRKETLAKMLANVNNREYFFELLSRCENWGNVGNETNAAFRFLGRRDVGQELLADIFAADSNAMRLMQMEAETRAMKGQDNE